MEYTYEDVLKHCADVLDLLKDDKNRRNMDRRNYLIALLHYGFNKTEKEIGTVFSMKRETVTSAKFHPYQLLENKDAIFIKNVKDLIKALPYDFPNHYSAKSSKKNTVVTVYLDKPTEKKMRAYMKFKSINRIDVAVKDLLIKALKLWEE